MQHNHLRHTIIHGKITQDHAPQTCSQQPDCCPETSQSLKLKLSTREPSIPMIGNVREDTSCHIWDCNNLSEGCPICQPVQVDGCGVCFISHMHSYAKVSKCSSLIPIPRKARPINGVSSIAMFEYQRLFTECINKF